MLKKVFSKVLLPLFIVICCFFISSCENFLEGNNVKQALEDEIHYQNAPVANVTIRKSFVDDNGTLEPAGVLSDIKTGYPFSVSYTPSSGYYFVNWTAIDELGNSYSDSEVTFEDSKSTSTKVTVNTQNKVIILANSAPKEKLTITFLGENGNITPVDTKSYYKGEIFNLNFTAVNGYAFVKWELYDEQNKEVNISDFLDLKENIAEQTVKVMATGKALTLKTVGVERPKVTLTLPANGKDNLVRNTPIRIMFSKPMDKSRFTSEYIEVKQGVLRDTGDAIILESEPVENLNYLSNTDQTMLTIQLPEGSYYVRNSYVNVKISKELCTQDINKIRMADDYEFQFQVGTETDGLAPVIDAITVTNASTSKQYEIIDFGTNGNYDRDKVDSVAKINAAYKINDTDAVQSSENVLKNIVSGATFNIDVKASDLDGAGSSVSSTRKEANVSKIGYRVTNVISMTNGNYSFNNNDPFIYENTLDYNSTDGSGETFSINLSDLDGHNLKAPEGILRVDVYAIDKKENSGYWETMWYKYQNGYRTFFVVNDTTAPVISEPVWQKTFTKFDFTAPSGSEQDYKANPQYISNKTYLKFKLDETTCGVTDMDIELKKNSDSSTISLKDNVQIRYSPTDSFANSVALNINSQESTATKMVFNPAVEDKLPAYHSGWYYITNIVDSTLTDNYTLTVKLTDAAGFVTKQLISTVKSDCSIPQWDSTEGPKVIQYSYGTGNNANNVFPRVDNRGITSKSFRGKPEIKNASGNYVRWFYTNASSSGNFGVALKQELTNEAGDKIKYLYSSNTLSDSDMANISLKNIYENGTVFTDDLSNFFYKTGTYSFAVFDEAENCTDIQTFVIVRDNIRPTRVTSAKYISSDELLNYPNSYGANSIVAGNNRDIKYLFSLSTDCDVSVNNAPQYAYSHNATNNADWRLWCSSKNNTTGHFSRYSTFTGSAQAIKNSKWIMRVTGNDTSDQVFIATTISTSNGKKVYTKVDSNLRSVSGEYWEDAYPSRTGSGITNYYIARTYNKWRGSSGSTTVWEPNFPAGTDLSDLTLTDVKAQTYLTEANSEGPVCCSAEIAQSYGLTYDEYYHGGWIDYDVNKDGDIEIPIYSGPTPETYNYKYGAPIAICFKDGCGNLNFVNITRPGWNEYAHYAYDFNFQ